MIGSGRGFQIGVTSAYTPTSTFVTFGKAPGVGTKFVYEVIQPSTAMSMDFKIVQSLSGSSGFTFSTTSYTDITSSFAASMTKQAHTFAFQARQSTNSTSFNGTIKVRWLSVV